jgi:hypothetical protein
MSSEPGIIVGVYASHQQRRRAPCSKIPTSAIPSQLSKCGRYPLVGVADALVGVADALVGVVDALVGVIEALVAVLNLRRKFLVTPAAPAT